MKPDKTRREIFTAAVIFLTAAVLLSVRIGSPAHSNPDEKRYVQSAVEMVEDGDWVTPRYHGRPRFQKPILFYWLASAGVAVTGNRWGGARLPSVLFGALTVVLTYIIGRVLYCRRAGLFSAGFLLTSWLFFSYSRLATPDVVTLFFVTLAFAFFIRLYFKSPGRGVSLLVFASMAAATLAKGPLGFLLPVIVITAYVSIYKKKGFIRSLNLPLGAALFLAIALPWFMAMIRIHGSAYTEHIWRTETVNRVRAMGPFSGLLRYLAMAPVVFLPATLFLPTALIKKLKRKRPEKADVFMLLWIAAVIVFFSVFSTKKIHYLLMCAPAVCIFIGSLAGPPGKEGRWPGIMKPVILFSAFFYILAFGAAMPLVSGENGLLEVSRHILETRKEGEIVGVGSHFISHNRLDSYLDLNVKKVNVDLFDPDEQRDTSVHLLKNFLTQKERVFCVMTRQDYSQYIPDGLKRRLYILSSGWYWKKPNQLEIDRRLFRAAAKNDRDALRELLKNEILLVSNTP